MRNSNIFKSYIISLFVFYINSNNNINGFIGKFTNLGFSALDIAVNSEGDVCVIGLNKSVYHYDFLKSEWILLPFKFAAKRIDMNEDGTIFITSNKGIFYLDTNNKWKTLPGKAKDIAVGNSNTIWKIGIDQIKTKEEFKNYGVWKLICDSKRSKNCNRKYMRFRKGEYEPYGENDYSSCYWFRTDGYGKNIDIFPNGDAIIAIDTNSETNTSLKIVNKNGMFFKDFLCGGKDKLIMRVNDITVGNNGVVYVATNDGSVRKCNTKDKLWYIIVLDYVSEYKSLPGGKCPDNSKDVYGRSLKAHRISAGPYDQLWFVHKIRHPKEDDACNKLLSRMVFSSSRFK